MDVVGLEVEEVQEGGVVHGGRGPRCRDLRGIGGQAMCEGKSWRRPRRGGGERRPW